MIDKRLLKLNFKTFTSAIADLALPRVCVVCGQGLMPEERHICLECLADLPLTRFSAMSHNPMADLYNARIESLLVGSSSGQSPAKLRASRSSHRCATLAVPPLTRPRVDTVSPGLCPEGYSLAGSDRREPGGVMGAEPPSKVGYGTDTVPYQYATALFYYSATSPYRKITQALKYHRDFGAGRIFARMLGEELRASGLYADVDLVVPVPLHWTRRLRRGYNQAEIIAREVASALGARMDSRALRRVRRTATQVRLTGKDRAANLAGAFMAAGSPALTGAHHVLLIDDVFTTGATLAACYDALRQQIPPEKRISIATLGFVQNG